MVVVSFAIDLLLHVEDANLGMLLQLVYVNRHNLVTKGPEVGRDLLATAAVVAAVAPGGGKLRWTPLRWTPLVGVVYLGRLRLRAPGLPSGVGRDDGHPLLHDFPCGQVESLGCSTCSRGNKASVGDEGGGGVAGGCKMRGPRHRHGKGGAVATKDEIDAGVAGEVRSRCEATRLLGVVAADGVCGIPAEETHVTRLDILKGTSQALVDGGSGREVEQIGIGVLTIN